MKPDSGEITLFGTNSKVNDQQKLKKIGYMGQQINALWNLKLIKAVSLTARLKGMGRKEAIDEAEYIVNDLLGVPHLANKTIGDMSGGERRIGFFCISITGDPEILILDEPTNDMAPEIRRKVWDLLLEKNRQGKTILLVTHNVSEAEKVLDKVLIMNKGEIIASGPISNIKKMIPHQHKLEFYFDPDYRDKIVNDFNSEFDIDMESFVSKTKGSVPLPSGKLLEIMTEVINLNQKNIIEDFKLIGGSLEDIYFYSTKNSFLGEGYKN